MSDKTQDGWTQYKRKGVSEMRPYVPGEDLTFVSTSEPDRIALANGSTDFMVARNPKDHTDQWLVAGRYFRENLEPVKTQPEPQEWNCPHCGSKKDAWFSRSEPLGNYCQDCGKNVDEPQDGEEWLTEDDLALAHHLKNSLTPKGLQHAVCGALELKHGTPAQFRADAKAELRREVARAVLTIADPREVDPELWDTLKSIGITPELAKEDA